MSLLLTNLNIRYTHDVGMNLCQINSSNQTYGVARDSLFNSNELYEFYEFQMPFDFNFTRITCYEDDYIPVTVGFLYNLRFYKNTVQINSEVLQGAVGSKTLTKDIDVSYAAGDILAFTVIKAWSDATGEEFGAVLYGNKLDN